MFLCCCACRSIVTSNASHTREWNSSSIARRVQTILFSQQPSHVVAETDVDDDMPPLEISESRLIAPRQARDVVVETHVNDDMPPLISVV